MELGVFSVSLAVKNLEVRTIRSFSFLSGMKKMPNKNLNAD